jgi:hypothetical protein
VAVKAIGTALAAAWIIFRHELLEASLFFVAKRAPSTQSTVKLCIASGEREQELLDCEAELFSGNFGRTKRSR